RGGGAAETGAGGGPGDAAGQEVRRAKAMPRARKAVLAGVLGLLVWASAAGACSICDGKLTTSPTFRQEAAVPIARVILHGTMANPRTSGGLNGQTDFHIKTVLRSDPAVKGKAMLVLPRYLPINEKEKPPHYLLFCDVEKEKVDAYRGVPIHGPATVEYVKK